MDDAEFINFDAAPTTALFEREMERVVGSLKPGRNVADFKVWGQQIKTGHGHEPYGRLRRAVSLLVTQSDEIPVPSIFAMFMREAERQLATERSLNAGLLPVDEVRREREDRERYEAAYKNVGPGTEAREQAICTGIAKQRKRKRLLTADPTIDTATAFRSPQEKEDFGPGMDEPDQGDVQVVYDERRVAGVPLGGNPSATSRVGGMQHISYSTRDPVRFLKAGGWRTSRQILEERRASGRLEPRMEEYLLERSAEEERDAPAPGADRPSGEPPPV